jgi:hypothetical protein
MCDAIYEISQYRQVIHYASSRWWETDLGPPLEKFQFPACHFPSVGPVYTDVVLQREAQKMARRSHAEKFFPEVLNGRELLWLGIWNWFVW